MVHNASSSVRPVWQTVKCWDEAVKGASWSVWTRRYGWAMLSSR